MDTSPSVLIVDDELDNFDILEGMLLPQKYHLHYAANALQALNFLETHQPDVILLDVMMPEIDGIELCHRIKLNREWCHIPVVMVNSLNSKEDLAKCLEAGANDFLSKPVSSIELCARVGSMLRIKQQHDKLQQLLRLREDVVNMIVHDLRNPLSSIILLIELLRIEDSLSENIQRKVDKIKLATDQLRLQIDSLLFVAKLESGKMVLSLTEIDLYPLCVSALNNFEEIAAQKSITLVSHLPAVGKCIQVDANIFRRILDNLLANSIKFSPSFSEITLQAHYLENGGAVVQVIDNGPGVSEALKDRIFEKYEIGTPMNNVTQTGLGLAFVKMAIEAHGGTVNVENNSPRGTTFTLELPG